LRTASSLFLNKRRCDGFKPPPPPTSPVGLWSSENLDAAWAGEDGDVEKEDVGHANIADGRHDVATSASRQSSTVADHPLSVCSIVSRRIEILDTARCFILHVGLTTALYGDTNFRAFYIVAVRSLKNLCSAWCSFLFAFKVLPKQSCLQQLCCNVFSAYGTL